MSQYVRVPIELLKLDANALQLYVAIASHTRPDRPDCWASNARLGELTQQSVASVKRALTQLIDAKLVERHGSTRRRLLRVTAIRLTDEPNVTPIRLTGEPSLGSRVSHRSRRQEVEDTHSLRSCDAASDDERGDDMIEQPEQLFPMDEPVREKPAGHAALAAFIEAYGNEPISRSMIGRLGKRFKQLSDTYGADVVRNAAMEMGLRRVANPNAAESFVLRMRGRDQEQPTTTDGWSQIASSAFDRWASESRAN